MSPISSPGHQPANQNRYAVLAGLPKNYGLDNQGLDVRGKDPKRAKVKTQEAAESREGFVLLNKDAFSKAPKSKLPNEDSWAVLDAPPAAKQKAAGWLKSLVPGLFGQ